MRLADQWRPCLKTSILCPEIHAMSTAFYRSTCIRPTFLGAHLSLARLEPRARKSLKSQLVASDTFCKDVVNVRKFVDTEGSVLVTFLGAEGTSVQVSCPLVPLPRPPPSPRYISTCCVLKCCYIALLTRSPPQFSHTMQYSLQSMVYWMRVRKILDMDDNVRYAKSEGR